MKAKSRLVKVDSFIKNFLKDILQEKEILSRIKGLGHRKNGSKHTSTHIGISKFKKINKNKSMIKLYLICELKISSELNYLNTVA